MFALLLTFATVLTLLYWGGHSHARRLSLLAAQTRFDVPLAPFPPRRNRPSPHSTALRLPHFSPLKTDEKIELELEDAVPMPTHDDIQFVQDGMHTLVKIMGFSSLVIEDTHPSQLSGDQFRFCRSAPADRATIRR
ncbi:hypothetical protein BFP70_16340 [Thioclava sp. SK-1]|uniref:hypothetical protein n=1 Tax=Thioclava sp. SK-1 TaxID=1889770 RepID=UPI000826C116|nr:hypothetical protein [Thioclava sp. SK-1]OCX61023.1 hypothetical protein BFP70_16340 [Thioclava sp. SK-1]